MRILLDENVPVDLAAWLNGHDVESVSGMGWAGVKNGELMRLMRNRFDALITMDRNIPHQQEVAGQPFGVILIQAPSSRVSHLGRISADILVVVEGIAPGELRRVSWRP